ATDVDSWDRLGELLQAGHSSGRAMGTTPLLHDGPEAARQECSYVPRAGAVYRSIRGDDVSRARRGWLLGFGPVAGCGRLLRYAERLLGLARSFALRLLLRHDWTPLPCGLGEARRLGCPAEIRQERALPISRDGRRPI